MNYERTKRSGFDSVIDSSINLGIFICICAGFVMFLLFRKGKKEKTPPVDPEPSAEPHSFNLAPTCLPQSNTTLEPPRAQLDPFPTKVISEPNLERFGISLEAGNLNFTAQYYPGVYSFLVELNKLASIVSGWKVKFSSVSSYESCMHEKQKWHIIGVLGYYSKGKSLFVRLMYLAGKDAFNQDYSIKNEFSIKTGRDVTTEGIAGVFTGEGDSNTVILDTAGRNAPAHRMNEAEIDEINEAISEKRSTERLLDSIVCDISNMIFYIVDELLNEDQRTILHIIRNLSEHKTGQTQNLCIVHNFKTLNPRDADRVSFLKSQLGQTFNAEEKSLSDHDKALYERNLEVWESHFHFKEVDNNNIKTTSVITVLHCIMYNHNDEEGRKRNHALFRYLLTLRNKQEFGTSGSPLMKICNSISNNLPHYVREKPSTSFSIGRSSANASASSITGYEGTDEPPNYHALIKATTYYPNSILELLKWNEWEMPIYSDGDFVPNYNCFDTLHFFFVRMDLSGLSEQDEKNIHELDQIQEGANYWHISKVKTKEANYLVIQGYRRKDEVEEEYGNKMPNMLPVYGRFRINLYYNGGFYDGQLVKSFSNGVLTVKIYSSTE